MIYLALRRSGGTGGHIGTELTFRYKKIVNVLAYILVIVDILGVRKS